MKKTLSVFLVLTLVVCSFAFAVSASAAGNSITLPIIYNTDGSLKYTVAFVCSADHIDPPVDDNPVDGKIPTKEACTEHETVFFYKDGDSEGSEPDYAIYYDMSKFGTPNYAGELRGIDTNFFEFQIEIAQKYEQHITVTSNGKVITPNQTSGRYVLPMGYSYHIEIPEGVTPEGENVYPNFTLRRVYMRFPATATKEGYNLYGVNGMDGKKPATDNIFERQNGIWGEDYYFVLLVQKGYRECLKGIPTEAQDFDQAEYLLGVKMYANPVIGSPLPQLGSDEKVAYAADIYENRTAGNLVYAFDYLDDDTDDIDRDNENFTLVGRIFKVDGSAMTYTEIEPVVSGVTEDSKNNIFQWLFRILRLILNFFKTLNLFN
ncbi:MAG: hypothetical protein IK118_03070 [Clostridia bacterium]|nr:hypothetical protein [Clostridia bacterium]MBR5427306.1 hypothetical protein [Clostridia bacterium]